VGNEEILCFRAASLPYHFLLLLDGVDEIADSAQRFFDELTALVQQYKIKCVISLRESGLGIPANLKSIESCFKVQSLSDRDCAEIAEKNLADKDLSHFYSIFREKVRTFASGVLTLPFGFTIAIDYYRRHKRLPDSLDELISDIIVGRIAHNRTRDNVQDPSIRYTSKTIINRLAQAISFEFRVVHQKATVTEEESENIVVAALQRIKNDNVFGAKDLTDEKAFAIAIHYRCCVKALMICTTLIMIS
jgi:hypothetical protein